MWESTQFLLQQKLMQKSHFLSLQCFCHLWVFLLCLGCLHYSVKKGNLIMFELLVSDFDRQATGKSHSFRYNLGGNSGQELFSAVWMKLPSYEWYDNIWVWSSYTSLIKVEAVWSSYTSYTKGKDWETCHGAALFSRRNVGSFYVPWSYASQNRSAHSLHLFSDIKLFSFTFFWITDCRTTVSSFYKAFSSCFLQSTLDVTNVKGFVISKFVRQKLGWQRYSNFFFLEETKKTCNMI